jgi:protein TonB
MLLISGCAQSPFGAKDEPGDAAQGHDETIITVQTPQVKAYRKVAARHIYTKYPKRIYPTKIPPLVYAVVVVETHLDAKGNVTRIGFSRTPEHAPEVAPQIADMIRSAGPFPSPGAVGAHTYVDTWLWDKSERFQLDTLTKGQLSR